MGASEIEWAGVRFITVGHHDAQFFRTSGLYGFARREWNGERTLLYIGHADLLAIDAAPGSTLWSEALALGMNELHLNLQATERLDRLQLTARVTKRCEPILNLIERGEQIPPRKQAGAL